MSNAEHADFPRAGIGRRLGALMYDYLVAMAVFAVAHFIGFIAIAVLANYVPGLCEDPHNVGQCVAESKVYSGYLLAVVGFFFVWFWSHGGQTLGMRAWRLKVQNMNGSSITMMQAFLRLCTAFLGLGNIWLLSKNSEGMSLPDRISGTEIVVLSPEANKLRNWKKL